jgi:hypothetical protein
MIVKRICAVSLTSVTAACAKKTRRVSSRLPAVQVCRAKGDASSPISQPTNERDL